MAKWIKICKLEDIPSMGSRIVVYKEDEIAIFKTRDNSVFAVNNECPHKQGKLAEGLVHETMVTCPLHNWDIDLSSGEAIGENSGCTKVYESRIEDNFLFLSICE
jgi:nitrite reductase (NADH) small subunit